MSAATSITTIPPAVYLADLAKRINSEHKMCLWDAKQAVLRAIEVGRLLSEAKAKVPHGGWAPWVKQNCKFKIRQASSYMLVYESREQIGRTSADLSSLNAALKMLAGPEAEESAESVPPCEHCGEPIGKDSPRLWKAHKPYHKICYSNMMVEKMERRAAKESRPAQAPDPDEVIIDVTPEEDEPATPAHPYQKKIAALDAAFAKLSPEQQRQAKEGAAELFSELSANLAPKPSPAEVIEPVAVDVTPEVEEPAPKTVATVAPPRQEPAPKIPGPNFPLIPALPVGPQRGAVGVNVADPPVAAVLSVVAGERVAEAFLDPLSLLMTTGQLVVALQQLDGLNAIVRDLDMGSQEQIFDDLGEVINGLRVLRENLRIAVGRDGR